MTKPVTIPHFINGATHAPKGARLGQVFNPATGQQTGEVVLASTATVGEAVAAAKAAFPGWAATPPLRRARVLNKFLRLLEDRTEELARCISSEHGKV
ncbi:MAG TPA: aldehyde dehydrogenase family protein, partial [Aestuariivirga sp.]|nr:aldehyde dehydrogenase family protein [Aestuariivirga sp.]